MKKFLLVSLCLALSFTTFQAQSKDLAPTEEELKSQVQMNSESTQTPKTTSESSVDTLTLDQNLEEAVESAENASNTNSNDPNSNSTESGNIGSEPSESDIGELTLTPEEEKMAEDYKSEEDINKIDSNSMEPNSTQSAGSSSVGSARNVGSEAQDLNKSPNEVENVEVIENVQSQNSDQVQTESNPNFDHSPVTTQKPQQMPTKSVEEKVLKPMVSGNDVKSQSASSPAINDQSKPANSVVDLGPVVGEQKYKIICQLNDDIREITAIQQADGSIGIVYKRFDTLKTIAIARRDPAYADQVADKIYNNLAHGTYPYTCKRE